MTLMIIILSLSPTLPCIPFVRAGVILVGGLEINLSLHKANKHSLLIDLPLELWTTSAGNSLRTATMNEDRGQKENERDYLIIRVQFFKVLLADELLHNVYIQVTDPVVEVPDPYDHTGGDERVRQELENCSILLLFNNGLNNVFFSYYGYSILKYRKLQARFYS